MKIKVLLVVAAAAAMSLSTGFAAAVAYDDASNSVYDTWESGDNGGTGFGGWVLTSSTSSGTFVGSSQTNGAGTEGNIDIGGRSWGLYANSGNTSDAVRTFSVGGLNASNVLAPGESFQISFDTGYIDGGTVGFALQNASFANRLEVYFVGGDPSYTVNVGGTPFSTGVGFSSAGITIKYTQLASDGWTLDVGGTTILSSTTAPVAASDISQVRLFNFNAGPGQSHDQYFNAMSVVPEPAAAAMMVAGAGVLAFRRRRIN